MAPRDLTGMQRPTRAGCTRRLFDYTLPLFEFRNYESDAEMVRNGLEEQWRDVAAAKNIPSTTTADSTADQ